MMDTPNDFSTSILMTREQEALCLSAARQLKSFLVAPELVATLDLNRSVKTVPGSVPADAVIHRMAYDIQRDVFVVIVGSATFSVTPLGQYVPEMSSPTFIIEDGAQCPFWDQFKSIVLGARNHAEGAAPPSGVLVSVATILATAEGE